MTGERYQHSAGRTQNDFNRGHCTTEGEAFQMKEYMEKVSVKEAIAAGRVDTLCWDCQNAMMGGGAAGLILSSRNPLTDGTQMKPITVSV